MMIKASETPADKAKRLLAYRLNNEIHNLYDLANVAHATYHRYGDVRKPFPFSGGHTLNSQALIAYILQHASGERECAMIQDTIDVATQD